MLLSLSPSNMPGMSFLTPTPAPRSLPLPPIVQGAAVWLQQLTAPERPCPKGWAHTRPLCALSAESGESDSCFRGDKGLCSIRVPLWPEQLFLWRGFSPPVSSSDSFRQHLNPHSPCVLRAFLEGVVLPHCPFIGLSLPSIGGERSGGRGEGTILPTCIISCLKELEFTKGPLSCHHTQTSDPPNGPTLAGGFRPATAGREVLSQVTGLNSQHWAFPADTSYTCPVSGLRISSWAPVPLSTPCPP